MAKTKRAKARVLKARRAVARKMVAACAAATRPKRKYVTEERLMEALRLEHVGKEKAGRRKTDPVKREVTRRRFGAPTKIEYRTGSGVTVKEITNGRGFGETPGVIRQSAGCCNPAIHHCMDRFYGQIDRDLDDWRFKEDLKLKVPYAVKIWKHHKRHVAILRKDAKARGII